MTSMLSRFLAAALLMLGACAGALGCSGEEVEDVGTGNPSETAVREEPDPWGELRSRPLDLPAVRKDGSCLDTNATVLKGIPGSRAGLGNGPVYPVFQAIPRVPDLFPLPAGQPGSDWHEAKMLWVSTRKYDGAVLVRGRQLDGPNRLGFGFGTPPEWELRLPAGGWQEARRLVRAFGKIARPRKGWRLQVERLRIRSRGCYGFQVDGESFSERIVFYAVLQSGRPTDY
jgi:hypothetical protein